ncbi:hypothetical protein SAMN05216490_0167 [Mucilaginibacter mallensis]|uniref:Adhesin domain-containing protein n=1 Tax=Mucilaginibacter mallensis TaxID=652787 RepID=A0A1H1MUW1_MUCMA|nr:hypothetical protein [Mucilaginibacter mallensis]SDR90392.1 hypothetical protein SAMN05216490_0167 [Mucilaginibacter mallensis]
MKLRIFKSTMAALAVVLLAAGTCFAQATISIQEDSAITIAPQAQAVPAVGTVTTISAQSAPVTKVKTQTLTITTVSKITSQVKSLTAQVNAQTRVALNDLKVDIDGLTPAITTGFKAMSDGSSYSNEAKNDDGPLTKNYSKTYPVDANDALSIDNRYGSVIVNTWAKNEIKVDVQIKVSSSNDNATQKVLDNVTISDDKSGNTVSFKTNIGETKGSWTSWISGSHSSSKMEINYVVYMPARNELIIDNRYGAIVLPDLQGKVTINCAYGSFAAKSLTNESAIRVKYGSASIENLGSSSLEVSYGSLHLGSADKLLADVSYSGADIGKLKTSGAINIRYGGGLKIGGLEKTVKNLAINASYTGVSIGLSGDENANFDVTVHYGDFNYNEHNVTITGKSPADGDKGGHFTKSFKGYIGKGDAEKTIAINSSYASVKFE